MPEFLFAGERYQSPVELALEVIGGKWKMPILWRLNQRPWRYGELQRDLHRVTHKMLSQQLRELEEAGLITRTVHAVVPPRVDYAITMLGQSALPAIDALRSWGAAYRTARDPGWQPTLDGPTLHVRPLAASDFEACGSATHGELKALMLACAFTQVDVVWFHIGRDNHRSRKAAEKIGAVLDHEGLRDQQPYCWYRIDRPPA